MKAHKRKNGSPRCRLEEKAEKIRECGQILHLGSNRFRVSSQSQSDKFYDVEFLDSWKCTCPYNSNHHGDCKHIIAVQGLVMNVPKLKAANCVIKVPGVACTECGSADCRYYETRKTLRGQSIRYKCKICGKRFTNAPGILGRHYPMDVVTDAMEDVVTGKSLNAASRGLQKRSMANGRDGRAPHPSTISRWMKSVVDKTARVAKSIPIQVGAKWHVDELFFRTAGKDRWLVGVMDSESRFMLSHETTGSKMGYNATNLLKDAIDTAGKKPSVMVSDRLSGFRNGFKKAISCRSGDDAPVHINSASVRKRHINNNLYERYNGSIKDRIKTARGFCCSDPPLHSLYIIYHNFIRPHMGLGMKTPAEFIGVRILGSDKWTTLLAYASTLS